jgi:hypothetical protein
VIFVPAAVYIYHYNEDVNDDDDHHSAGVNVSLAQLSFRRKAEAKDKTSFGSLNFLKNSKISGLMSGMLFKKAAKMIIGKDATSGAAPSIKEDAEDPDADAMEPLRPDKPRPVGLAKLSFASAGLKIGQVKNIVTKEYEVDPSSKNALALMKITSKFKGGKNMVQTAEAARCKEEMDDDEDEEDTEVDSVSTAMQEKVKPKPKASGLLAAAAAAAAATTTEAPDDEDSNPGPAHKEIDQPSVAGITVNVRRDSGYGAKDASAPSFSAIPKLSHSPGLAGGASAEAAMSPSSPSAGQMAMAGSTPSAQSQQLLPGPSIKVILAHRAEMTRIESPSH